MKKINIFNFVMAVPLIIADIFFIIYQTILPKTIASAIFVLIGLVNLIYVLKNKVSNKKFVILLFVGLCFAFLGDVLLEIEFIVGAAFFAIGHIFFFIAYCFLQKFHIKDLLFGSLIFVPAAIIILFAPIFTFESALMQIVCVVYALIISLMVGKSIANFVKERNTLNLLVLIGSALFCFSDIMLLFNNFAAISNIFGLLCLATYYPAEFILAYSIAKAK